MPNRRGVIAVFACAAFLSACQNLPSENRSAANGSAAVQNQPSTTENYGPGFTQVGLASWYGPQFHGNHTADGERFDMNAMTAAHRTLPFNSYVRVINLATTRSVVVRINDRGPYAGDRIIDLSARAARALGIKDDGIARVRIELVNIGNGSTWDRTSPVWAREYP